MEFHLGKQSPNVQANQQVQKSSILLARQSSPESGQEAGKKDEKLKNKIFDEYVVL